MRAFFLAILVGILFLSITSINAQMPVSDPDYVPPKIVTIPRLTPPKESVESGLGGVVRVEVTIDEAGNVTSVKEALGPGTVCQQVTRADVVAMRSAAQEAAYLAKFDPATRKGKPVESSTWLNFTFPGKAAGTPEFTAAPPRPRDESKFTAKSDSGFSAANPPPPDYKGPVHVGGSGQDSNPATTNMVVVPDLKGDQIGNIPKQINGGVLNGKAISLTKPPYPPAARAVRAEGAVSIEVLIDENGDVFSASAVSGHPLLRAASAQAACGSKFNPTQLSGNPVKVTGIIVYNFVP
jgi:hypothetical protein